MTCTIPTTPTITKTTRQGKKNFPRNAFRPTIWWRLVLAVILKTSNGILLRLWVDYRWVSASDMWRVSQETQRYTIRNVRFKCWYVHVEVSRCPTELLKLSQRSCLCQCLTHNIQFNSCNLTCGCTNKCLLLMMAPFHSSSPVYQLVELGSTTFIDETCGFLAARHNVYHQVQMFPSEIKLRSFTYSFDSSAI